MTTGRQLRLYNSLGRRMVDFSPSGPITGMYSCGPTVYSYPHLGNMRPYVFADTLRRALRWKDLPVRHVLNITDVGHAVADSDAGQDKMELAASRERRSVQDIAEFYTRAYFADLDALNVLPASEYPRASAYVDEMIEFTKHLEKMGYTYQLPSGLYFDTSRSADYGRLAMMDIAGQREGSRIEPVQGRKHKTDFALWRAEDPGGRRAMRWHSPWGWGAPGWHLECSVMSILLLGEHFDIHTGGVDHRELHHVNEIAQSEAYLADGKPWVRYWLHNEFLQMNAQKMAKSAGGAPRLADLTESGYHPLAFRLFLLGGHYRSQIDFTIQAIDAAQSTLRRLTARIEPLRPLPAADRFIVVRDGVKDDPVATNLLDRLDEAVSSDLATPKMLSILQDTLRDPEVTATGQRMLVAAADSLLGLGLDKLDPLSVAGQRSAADLAPEQRHHIEGLVAARTRARTEHDWTRADEIRAELDDLGVQIADTARGPEWQLR